MNYYKHHLGDYAANTRHLSLLEHGVYRCLIDIYYISEAPLPKDLRAICRLVCARSKDEREAVELVLEEFFVLTDEGWSNSRCDLEIGAARAKSEKNKELGKLGGRPKKTQSETVSENNPNGFQEDNQTVSENNPSHKPVASSHKPVVNPPTVIASSPLSTGVAAEQPPTSTRKGQVCGLLRKAGMADAAPHYLDDATWEAILGKRTNEEIVEVALAKMAARPNQRTGLKYIAPALLEDPAPIAANARASPGFVSQRDQQRQEVIEVLTGKNRTHERTEPAAIDAECQRLAG